MKNKKEEFLRVLNNRYACKKFDKDKKISGEDFKFIMEAGRLSPSSFGFEPWKFLLLENEDIKNELKECAWGAKASLEGASHFVIVLARKKIDMQASSYLNHIMKDIQKLDDDIVKGKSLRFEEFQKENFALLSSDEKLFDWASKQTYIALGNMMMAAAYIEIDSCPIEGYNIENVNKVLQKHNLFDAEHFGVSHMVSFGYRAEDITPKKRQQLEDILTVVK